MLSRLVCRRNRGANGSKKAASSGSASGEALGTLFIFMLHSTTETNKVVLEKLEKFFQNNIGNPYDIRRQEELYKQAQFRVELRIPPGWEDEGKNSYKAYGDILLWFQLIDYARTEKKPIVFVTDDGKKDWWIRDTKGKPIKPLPALVQEMFVEAGV